MVRKYLTCFLILSLLNLHLFAQTKDEKKAAKEAARIETLKTTITNIGLGDSAPAELKLKKGGKLIGYVSEIKDGSIIFAEPKRATTHEIPYANINSIKAYEPKNRSQWKWYFLMGAALTVLTIFVIKECQKREKRGETCDPDTY